MCKFLYSEIVGEYEKNTGLVIVEEFCYCYIDLMVVLSVIVVGYVFFFWGKNVEDVVYNVVVLEEIFVMVFVICLFNSGIKIQFELFDKYYLCKYGVNVYYGQR